MPLKIVGVVLQGRILPQAEGARRHEAVADDREQRRGKADQQEEISGIALRKPADCEVIASVRHQNAVLGVPADQDLLVEAPGRRPAGAASRR